MNTIDNLLERDWSVTLLQFSLGCGFFSKVFYESPSLQFVGRLVADDLFEEWPLADDSDDTCTGLTLLRSFCEAWSPAQVDRLQSDYLRLFVGPGQPLAPPWESYYLSQEHLLFQEQTLGVRADYKRFGLQAPRFNNEPDDQLGLEFAFLLHLCTLGQAALERGDRAAPRPPASPWPPARAGQGCGPDAAALDETLQAQRHFLSAHLLRWAPQCLELIAEQASTNYYRGAGYLARGFLTDMAKTLGVPIRLGALVR